MSVQVLNKRQLPQLIISVTSHCGKHPWTSSQTRGIAKSNIKFYIIIALDVFSVVI